MLESLTDRMGKALRNLRGVGKLSERNLEEALKVAQQLTRIDPSLMSQTKQAINRAYSIMGLEQALDAGLDIDTLIEGEGMPSKRKFLAITREQGLRAALTWRDREA